MGCKLIGWLLWSPAYCSRHTSRYTAIQELCSRCISDVKEKKHYKEIPDTHKGFKTPKRAKELWKTGASKETKWMEQSKPTKMSWKKNKVA